MIILLCLFITIKCHLLTNNARNLLTWFRCGFIYYMC